MGAGGGGEAGEEAGGSARERESESARGRDSESALVATAAASHVLVSLGRALACLV